MLPLLPSTGPGGGTVVLPLLPSMVLRPLHLGESPMMDTSFHKKTCLSVYSELTMMSIKRFTSTWNSYLSEASATFARSATEKPSIVFSTSLTTAAATSSADNCRAMHGVHCSRVSLAATLLARSPFTYACHWQSDSVSTPIHFAAAISFVTFDAISRSEPRPSARRGGRARGKLPLRPAGQGPPRSADWPPGEGHCPA